jgi:hypothetical protein
MAFVASGFEHSVANMYFIPAGIMTQGFVTDPAAINANLNWVTMWTSNLIIVTIGNIVRRVRHRDGVQPPGRREGVGCREGPLGAREGSGNPEMKK